MKSTRAPVSAENSLGFRCWHGPGRAMPGAHTHLEIEANFLGRGAISYLFGGQRVDVGAGEWAIFWGSVPHQLMILEANSEICWFTLPLARFLGWNLPPVLTESLLGGRILQGKSDGERDAGHFALWETDLESGDAARSQIAELEIQAWLHRLALGLGKPQHSISGATGGEIGHIEKMAAFMAQNYALPIGTGEVARAAGIHPNYAMNLFKRGFGLSLGEFLLRTRLAQAQRLLVTSDRNVLDIAFSCGFGSASRFHAAFKQRCDQSPSDYRKSLRR